MDLSGLMIKGTGSYEVKQTSVDDGVLKKGDTYLECISSGSVAWKSDQAYGEWEFDLYKYSSTTDVFAHIISDSFTGSNGYRIGANSSERFILYRMDAGTPVAIMYTAPSYMGYLVWYRLRFTRTLDGKSYYHIKGGAYGTDDWTLIDIVGGAGTNPIIDNSYKISKYFILDLDSGDRIANIVMRKAVKQ